METKVNKLKNLQWLWKLIVGFFIGIISSCWFVFSKYSNFHDKLEEMVTTTKTTQQMALKSVIWNENIPLPERVSTCDVYLAAGYNSLTKKECEKIIDESEYSIFRIGKEDK